MTLIIGLLPTLLSHEIANERDKTSHFSNDRVSLLVSVAASIDIRLGLPRDIFRKVVHLIVQERFGWPESVAYAMKQEYTNWINAYDPLENVKQYIQVSFHKVRFSTATSA